MIISETCIGSKDCVSMTVERQHHSSYEPMSNRRDMLIPVPHDGMLLPVVVLPMTFGVRFLSDGFQFLYLYFPVSTYHAAGLLLPAVPVSHGMDWRYQLYIFRLV